MSIRFLDKTKQTGSTLQLVNGIFLLASFFFVRLCHGMYTVSCSNSLVICSNRQFTVIPFLPRDQRRSAPVSILCDLLCWECCIEWFECHVVSTSAVYLSSGLHGECRFGKMIRALQKRFSGSSGPSANGHVNGKHAAKTE